jgi:hypothetical protein
MRQPAQGLGNVVNEYDLAVSFYVRSAQATGSVVYQSDLALPSVCPDTCIVSLIVLSFSELFADFLSNVQVLGALLDKTCFRNFHILMTARQTRAPVSADASIRVERLDGGFAEALLRRLLPDQFKLSGRQAAEITRLCRNNAMLLQIASGLIGSGTQTVQVTPCLCWVSDTRCIRDFSVLEGGLVNRNCVTRVPLAIKHCTCSLGGSLLEILMLQVCQHPQCLLMVRSCGETMATVIS